jgi:ribosomal protein S18 acetylase RimI-like enzyme
MPGSIEIERVTLDTFEAAVPLFVAYRVFYEQDEDVESTRAFLRARLERDESFVFLALVDGMPAAFAQVYRSFTSVKLGESLVLNDLYVDERYRRCGLGRVLCERVIALGRERGSVSIELSTAVSNEQAQRLYEQLGFVRNDSFVSYYLRLSAR